ncbi:hypothetical protein Lser_V15G16837 [Lactuca serriola]
MTLLKLDERFWCTYFPTTLDGNAGTWFKTLRSGTINNFGQLTYFFLTNFMQLQKYKDDSHSIIGCKQKEGETVRKYFMRFTNAMLDIPRHDEGLIVGAFTWGILSGPLSQKLMGKKPQTRAELKEKVERYLRQEEGVAMKQAYLTIMASLAKHYSPTRIETLGGTRHFGRGKRLQGRFRSFARDDRWNRQPDMYVVADKSQTTKVTKGRYCEYHKSKTHEIINCSVLKKEMEEKQLKGYLIEIAWSLRPKFNTENTKDTTREHAHPKEILMVHVKRGRHEEQSDMTSITTITQGLTFSARDPRPKGWKSNNPLIIQASIKNVTIHRLYIDTCSLADIIYEQCFRLLPDKWKENHKPTTGRLVGFMGHSIWPLGTIHLPLMLTIHDKQRRKTALIDFLVT